MAANTKWLCILVVTLIGAIELSRAQDALLVPSIQKSSSVHDTNNIVDVDRNNESSSSTDLTTTTTQKSTSTSQTTATSASTATSTTKEPTTTSPKPTTITTSSAATSYAPTTESLPLPYWVVRDKGIVCILMSAGINITIDNKTQTVPRAANNGSHAEGMCGKNEQQISIVFGDRDDGATQNLTFVFTLVDKDNKHSLSKIVYTDGNQTVTMNVSKFWANDKGLMSSQMYRCNTTVTLYNDGASEVVVWDMSLEVFHNSNSTDFDSSKVSCTEDTKVSNLVPIIVGAALGGLILIVLIAYLIGRRRSRHGYEQV